jgi:hypothetical protein
MSDDQLQEKIRQEEKRAKRNKIISTSISLLLLMAAFIFGGLSLMKFYKMNQDYKWLAVNGEKAKAEVEGVDIEEGPNYVIAYKFKNKAPDGRAQDFRGSGKMSYKPHSGYVDIYYDKANPDHNRPANAKPPFDIWEHVIPPAFFFILSLIWKFLFSPVFFKTKKYIQHRQGV